MAAIIRVVFLKILLIYNLYNIYGERSFVVELFKARSEFNATIIRNFTIDLLWHQGHRVLNGSIVTEIELPKFDLKIVGKTIGRNGRKTVRINTTLDACAIIGDRYANIFQLSYVIMNYAVRNLKNFPRKCPMKKGTEIILSNFYIDANKLPPYLPELPFDIEVSMIYRKTIGWNLNVTGAITLKGKKKLL
ncbi:uncharacterized protein LOC142235282 [Haematobia irritans]|uniref:uncharacterized protein LOC142235282 n=1 Tax=Haematobia irritans TaxID=7368 RepID=UPI003F4FC0A1